MNRLVLVAALQRANAIARECSLALDGGAEYQVFDSTTSAADLSRIYRRRADHVRARDLENGGFEEAVAALDECGSGEVRLGQVSDIVGRRHYQLFLAPETNEIVSCLWVAQGD